MRFVSLIAAGALAAVSVPALAADLGVPEPLPMPEAPVAVPTAPTWSGFYLGALFGYSWGEADISGVGTADVDGIDGGVYVGANYQLGQFVVGAEADLLASGAEGSTADLELEQGFNGSLRGRVGIALDQFLLYGTAGVAATKLEVADGGGSDEQTLVGWTAGIGTEALVTDSITARVEYRYTGYQDKDFTVGAGSVNTDLSTHSVRAGVGVKF